MHSEQQKKEQKTGFVGNLKQGIETTIGNIYWWWFIVICVVAIAIVNRGKPMEVAIQVNSWFVGGAAFGWFIRSCMPANKEPEPNHTEHTHD